MGRPQTAPLTWAAWFDEACLALEQAIDTQTRLWLAEQVMSEGVREAIVRTAMARSHWEARLIALNAWADWQARNTATIDVHG
jgi:hypothetical protein